MYIKDIVFSKIRHNGRMFLPLLEPLIQYAFGRPVIYKEIQWPCLDRQASDAYIQSEGWRWSDDWSVAGFYASVFMDDIQDDRSSELDIATQGKALIEV